ncbi:Creatinase/aminopeptidase [Conidiobolus coronatus NRRL 28638]|uniref:Creatinase/aminopeptidase n=1 Tax=Conidiobolus coronatus (strain ATCC 28846 / CBS 209.66 / NRRL 28638) TaxID=796925 RepID=A0A137P5I9_CONC2|nr:Creatinase/aminopeptidase [Conidiobolus coronatus NRRL 28638]|eukprot:KXN70273.1 Creatinase/aminopeptidase [Conidiobolus coronatus NRRL 28638]
MPTLLTKLSSINTKLLRLNCNTTINRFQSTLIDMSPVNTTQRLEKLRQLFDKNQFNIDAYVVPSEDAHYSEYIAPVDARRAYISGFDGSAGLAVITKDQAALFTDGRYFLQAEQQMDSNWTLVKQGIPGALNWYKWIAKNTAQGSKIGLDPKLISVAAFDELDKELEKVQSEVVPIEENLIDKVWNDQPKRTANPVFALGLEYAGEALDSKLAKIREELKTNSYYGYAISALDEIAWLYNLRGSDIDYNPVFFAYSLITQNDAILYINESQITEEVKAHLGQNVKIAPYPQIFDDLKSHKSLVVQQAQKILISSSTSLALAHTVDFENIHVGLSPVTYAKGVKNATEAQGFRNCHVRDGVALVKYFSWLENELKNGAQLYESDAAEKLLSFRQEQEHFVGESFATISSTGPNGAIIHYHPLPGKCDIIDVKKMYLCDSGGQYKDGTTDVTRTWHFGSPSDFEKLAFTRVLQGVIGLEQAVFPEGTTGYILDSITRAPLWKSGLDYRHGTGHGVGSFLNVHEGPHGIGLRIGYNSVPLKVGNTVTNEPGYYEDGEFGIRTENIMIVKEIEGLKNFGDKKYFGFENITVCPIQTTLLDKSLLTHIEIKYINDYHTRVWETLSSLLKGDDFTLEWLKRYTQHI